MKTGKVYLVGAGPGDPDLITRKGLRLLRSADVVIYDRLIPHELLDEARADAELINGGKQPTRHRLAQADINALLVDRALNGKAVVRLKGGDPYVFGRGGEEALACRDHGIPYEVVPGVTSAVAVPACAGIPLTHRHISSAFAVIAGHEDPSKGASSINYAALAKLGGTIVIMMGVKNLPAITRQLLEHGLDPATPAAVIEWGATPRQRVCSGSAAQIAAIARRMEVKPPAITIIGEVARLREAGLAWNDMLPIEAIDREMKEHTRRTESVGATL
ncbi:MAG: uroporphyrinogen-III C-methyltransferase [Chloroflexi bacterium]|nr:uroporphyrinogen-III C-methyltransferase [Chloroflexota bacterium]